MRTSQKNKLRKFTKNMQGKLAFLFVLIALALFGLCLVVAAIGNDDEEEYSKIVLSQQNYSSEDIPSKRGLIKDRNGTVLATNEAVYNMILDPSIIYDDSVGQTEEEIQATLDTSIAAIAESLGLSEEETAELRSTIEADPSSQYIIYKKKLSEEQRDAYLALAETYNQEYKDELRIGQALGVWFETVYQRVYPYGSLASQVLGFSTGDGTIGNYGIEQYYNDDLVGTDGREYGYLNSDSNVERVYKEAVDGSTVISTIDYQIQAIVEKHIANFEAEIGAENVSAIVFDPNTGEILGMATNKSFDLNDPYDISAYYSDEELEAMSEEEKTDALTSVWKNFCISTSFEPGSTAKSFTIAAGLEENLISESSTFNCTGSKNVSGFSIKCHVSPSSHGIISLKDALAESCNVALMDIGEILGNQTFCSYQRLFSFGLKTGIDLPGEEAGIVLDADNMIASDLQTSAFGQTYTVTMAQMVAAYSSLINGGTYYEPHVVSEVIADNGSVTTSNTATVVRETVSQSTSDFINEALYAVVESGTGTKAQLPGYTIAGKTGTAEKQPRTENNYVVSFIGHAPYDDPQVVVYVVIDVPNVENQTAGGYATLMAKYIFREILPALNIFPTEETQQVDNLSTSYLNPDSAPAAENADGEANPEEGEGADTDTGAEDGDGQTEGGDDNSSDAENGGSSGDGEVYQDGGVFDTDDPNAGAPPTQAESSDENPAEGD